ncbi:hypothetical protein SCP_0705740 [Sparassis crispa]|uniref:Uncharacterized protein n=1 Tax=Sparassis crispa TaxID=139825 RepID=A0A401GT49_9APHY|nr:hypothetical protein SCP_0705740 [Sparassis crispa]GBE85387.1 hypothetical protein SCP_0705740 [Sparassis crispa]
MSSWSELALPELTVSELAPSEFASPALTSPELTWSELPFPKLPSYEFAYPEFNPMSSSLAEPALPKFASPIQKDVHPRSMYKRYLEHWEAAIWECIPYIKIPRLPPELMDCILDFVGGKPDFSFPDQQTLYSCALCAIQQALRSPCAGIKDPAYGM